ncbi:MAG: aminotransferase class III-fold pyridoxal phosphate-dependent enzyme [Pseudomonadota bacterium]
MNQHAIVTRAETVLPAGGFGNFDPSIFIREGKGARVWDEDGNEYVDLLIGSGPMLIGHGHEEVLEVVHKQVEKGMTFFANNELGVQLAEQIIEDMACAEQVRYVASGGEADMYAIRAARAFTGRPKVMKFEGGYHGMSAEAQMSLAPTSLVNFPNAVPDSAGISEGVREEMLIAPFNDVDFMRSLIAEHGDQIACVVVEPLQRIIPPAPGFLEALREETAKAGIVLIFDEIVTGYRLAYGGAQEAYGVTPDLCTLGKIVGGGFPLAATVGRADIMAHFDKGKVGAEGWLMQLGTLSGNPVACAAGLKTMEVLRREGAYDNLRANGRRIQEAIRRELTAVGVAHRIVGDPTLFEVVFTDAEVRDYRDWLKNDGAKTAAYDKAMRAHGVFKSAGKTYPSLALTEDDLTRVEEAIAAAARAI